MATADIFVCSVLKGLWQTQDVPKDQVFGKSVPFKKQLLYNGHSWGQKVIRFYDLDGNLIEVGTPG